MRENFQRMVNRAKMALENCNAGKATPEDIDQLRLIKNNWRSPASTLDESKIWREIEREALNIRASSLLYEESDDRTYCAICGDFYLPHEHVGEY